MAWAGLCVPHPGILSPSKGKVVASQDPPFLGPHAADREPAEARRAVVTIS